MINSCIPGPSSAKQYFSRNYTENTGKCFQTMYINVKYVRPDMSIIITVKPEARLIQRKC
jgi:hypothetical protein